MRVADDRNAASSEQADWEWLPVGLYLWFLIPFLLCTFKPRITPPGNVWEWYEAVSVLVAYAGPLFTARHARPRIHFFLYGLLCGAIIGQVFMPDSRDEIGIAMRQVSRFFHPTCFLTFMILFGLLCRTIPVVGGRFFDRRTLDPIRCTQCGYLLYGLTESRCPECGQRFAHVVPSQPSETPPSAP